MCNLEQRSIYNCCFQSFLHCFNLSMYCFLQNAPLSLSAPFFIAAFHNYSSIWSPYSPLTHYHRQWWLGLRTPSPQPIPDFLHPFFTCEGNVWVWETLQQHCCNLHVSKVAPTWFCFAGAEGCCARCLEVESGQYAIRALSLSNDLCRQVCSYLIRDCNILFEFFKCYELFIFIAFSQISYSS